MSDRFETQVSEMLTEHAKVDRSTIELARASIEALPDRKPVGHSGAVWLRPGRSLLRAPVFSLVGVCALVVAVVAVSVFGRFGNSAIARSAAPSSAAPVVTASPSPTDLLMPTAAQNTLSTRRPTPAFPETLPVAYTGVNAELVPAGWSPDGSHFAIEELPAAPWNSMIHIFDAAGVEVESRSGLSFAWLDTTSYVLIRDDSVAGVGGAWGAYVGRLGSTQLSSLGSYERITAGPSGAVALSLPWSQTLADPPQYVVVSGGKVSQPREGYPAAWSRDGSMLAVFHPTQDVGSGSAGLTGWLEVVRATGEHVASADKIESDVAVQVAFSPDGARVAFRDESNPTATLPHMGVLELPSGSLASIPRVGSFTWANNNELLFVEDNTVLSWSATTGEVSTFGSGDLVGASGRGVVVVGSDVTHRLTWTSSAPGSASGEFSLGAGPWVGIPDAAWSPYGKSLVLIAGDASAAQMDAVLVKF